MLTHAFSEDQIALETPQTIDPWSLQIDTPGILARNKLRSNIELSATRMNVACAECCGGVQNGAGPRGSDEEEEEPPARLARSGNPCSACHGCRAVEMSFVISVTIRVASFLPLPVPVAHLAGIRQPHIRYGPDGADRGEQRQEFLRTHAIEGAVNAAQRVGRQHHAKHAARLLLVSASVRRTSSWSLCVKSSRAKCNRYFDRIDPWPVVSAAPGADPATDSYKLEQYACMLDTTRDLVRAQIMSEMAGVDSLSSPSPSRAVRPSLSASRSTSPSPSCAPTANLAGYAGEGRSYSPGPAGAYPPASGSHLTGKLSLFRARSRVGHRTGQVVQPSIVDDPLRRESLGSQLSAPLATNRPSSMAADLGLHSARSGSMPSLCVSPAPGTIQRPPPRTRQGSVSTGTSIPTIGLFASDRGSSEQGAATTPSPPPLVPKSSEGYELDQAASNSTAGLAASVPRNSLASPLLPTVKHSHSRRRALRDLFTM